MVVWRPERRNKFIGTKSSGYSKSNDMRIPASWLDKNGNCSLYYERLDLAHIEEVSIGGFQTKILYERPQEGFSYGCSPSDVVKLLALASKFAPAMPNIIAFRQPTRKQRQQLPVWGRFLFAAQFDRHGGTAIVLEAQELGGLLKWPRDMSLEDRAEFARLIGDGHAFMETKRFFEAQLSEEGIRNTVLYRTALHELGHLADYHQKVLVKEMSDDAETGLAADLYHSRPTSEREFFAQRFADDVIRHLRDEREIPFAPQPFVDRTF